MTEDESILAVFSDIDPAADAIEKLRLKRGSRRLHERHLRHPGYRSHARASQPVDERFTRLALGGAVAGFMVGSFWRSSPEHVHHLLWAGSPSHPSPRR
jgi:hypothetical protein